MIELRCLVVVLVAVMTSWCEASAASATLAWDAAVTNAPAGYRLYYGNASGVYTNRLEAGSVAQKSVSNLVAGATYYFAVTGYDSSGQESDFSAEVTYIVPAPNTPPPAITLVSPVSGATFGNPANISATATIVTNSHVVTKVEFYNGSNCLGQGSGTPYCLIWSNVCSGTYNIKARLTYDGSVTMDSGVAVVLVADARPPVPSLHLTRTGTNTSVLSGAGSAGQVCEVQASQDLAHWSVLCNVTNDGSGAFAYTDKASVSMPVRYYRLRLIAP